jgi:hypothetical protein
MKQNNNGCIEGADGTNVKVFYLESMKSRVRCRKGCTCTNPMTACDGDKKLFYVFSGWEGSISDARVFNSGLKKEMRSGDWLLLDGRYGFLPQGLVPYRGNRHHLRE